jgi:hypothetical protein
MALVCTVRKPTPNLLETIISIDIPIQKAVAYNLKAQVFREGTISLKKGVNILSSKNLPSTLEIKSLRAQISNARILRVVPTIEEQERFELKEINTLIDKLTQNGKEIALLKNKKRIMEREVVLLNNITVPQTPQKDASFTSSRI